MRHATSNAQRAAQIAERAQKPTAAQFAAAATAKRAPEPKKAKATSTRPEKATEWGMGFFHPGGVRIVLRGDHNAIEKASAKLNKEAGMRVAFVVDIRAIPLAMLAETEHTGEGEEEETEE